MAEIRDDKLFQQPDESYLGECPICCLPLPTDDKKKTNINSCCSKLICLGCSYANTKRKTEEGLVQRCAYCREPLPKTAEEADQNFMKRIKANDPDAMRQMGRKCHNKGDYEGAFKYYTRAAELGDMDGHYKVSCLFYEGEGVAKDMEKEIYHLEEAAIYGHPWARHNLGARELSRGRVDRAKRHFIIAATLGYDKSMETLKDGYTRGFVGKDELAAALRAHHAAVEETKSQERETAALLN